MNSEPEVEGLQQLDDAADLAEFRAAKAKDDGRHVSLAELQAEH